MGPTVLQENLQGISANPLGRTGALISVHSTERGISVQGIVRGDKRDVGTCRVLLVLERRREGAQEQILPLDPVSPSPTSSMIPTAAGQEQSCCRAVRGQAQARGSDLGCGRVPPLAAASNVTELSSKCRSSSSPNHSLGGAAQCNGGEEQLQGLQGFGGRWEQCSSAQGMVQGAPGLCRKAGPCVRRSKGTDGGFLHFHCTIFRAPQIKEGCGALNVS